jgi:hypothetical protein
MDAHLAETFTHSLDLQLLLADSRIRARDVSPVIPCFALCSALRDLDEDLAHGIVNVPGEILADGGATAFPSDARRLRRQPAFRDWVRHESQRALISLDAADQQLLAWPDPSDPGLRVLRIFTRSMRGFFQRRVRRLYPEAFEPTTES